MEGILQLKVSSLAGTKDMSFNPCFSGRYSAMIIPEGKSLSAGNCFNPCFSGRYSAIIMLFLKKPEFRRVSILVLVEGILQ